MEALAGVLNFSNLKPLYAWAVITQFCHAQVTSGTAHEHFDLFWRLLGALACHAMFVAVHPARIYGFVASIRFGSYLCCCPHAAI